ncbi:MAG: hypothetical protein L3J47_06260 [Sulfurovum sp.]|nr:hypothetical protein [Sulfurovum sp.]
MPVLWSALLRLASLREDPVLYAKTRKEIVQALSSLPKSSLCGASSLVSAYLQAEYGYVVIHASAGKLLSAQKEIDRIQYPFVLSAVQASDAYLACRINSCFAADKNITGLIKKIETHPYQMQQKGVMRWQKR